MTARILYKSSVRHDIRKIRRDDLQRILNQIRKTLESDPRRAGEPLHGDFEGLFKLRIGEYRVIYALVGDDVLVLRVRHRGKAYE